MRLNDIFEITETKRDLSSYREKQMETYRGLWELKQRIEALEADAADRKEFLSEPGKETAAILAEKETLSAALQEQRDQSVRMDYQQRELLKGLARIVDECDDLIRSQTNRLANADPEDPATRVGQTWLRRLTNTRTNLMERLNQYGVFERTPVGFPNPDLDTIHSTVETDEVPPGEVVETLRCGLLWNGTILRYSEVVIAAPCSAVSEETAPPKHA
jgi:molecular chaperone GrpE (heat shock protein)